MLASQRQDVILAEIRAHGAVRVSDLVASLEVSDMTVRRDIAELERRGLARRVHGGAVDAGAQRSAHEPDFAAKRLLATPEKAAIGRAALDMIEPGSSVALSAGTTTHALSELIAATPELRPLTVVTNSLPVADTLYRAGDHTLSVVLTGGTRTPSDALVGPLAVSALAQLRVDLAFLGVHGMDGDGLSTPNLLEAETNRAMIACAGRTVVLADHSKWGEIGLCRIAPLDVVHTLVSDNALPAEAAETVRAAVGRLVVADPSAPQPVAASRHDGPG